MSVPKIFLLIFGFLILKSNDFIGQNSTDSLVLFSDLKFNSEFEKQQFIDFQNHKTDTFMLFMAIDEKMTERTAKIYYENFESIFDLIAKKKLNNIHTKKDIKKVFQLVHTEFLRNYKIISHFPAIFSTGTYNCVSASILYALIFNKLGVPYKIFQTPIHVYLVANPGEESVVIETTNPVFESDYFSNRYKENYVQTLKSVKMVTENETLYKSIDEIFHEKYFKGVESPFQYLHGFEYMNKAINKLQKNKYDNTYELLQKAYFFFPDQQLKSLLYAELIKKIEDSRFTKVEDIDYLEQLARYKYVDKQNVVAIFVTIINGHLKYTDKIDLCEMLYHQLIGQLTDPYLVQEISFAYYLEMSKHFRNTEKMVAYIEKAIAIRQNHAEANNLFLEQIERRLDCIPGFDILNDSISYLEKRYNYEFVDQLFADYRLIAFLKESYNFFSYNKLSEGEYYLKKFEEACNYPVSFERKKLVQSIELTYRALALYYLNRKNKHKVQKTIERGLKYVPGSRYLQTVTE